LHSQILIDLSAVDGGVRRFLGAEAPFDRFYFVTFKTVPPKSGNIFTVLKVES
jgi:hypothetical protein